MAFVSAAFGQSASVRETPALTRHAVGFAVRKDQAALQRYRGGRDVHLKSKKVVWREFEDNRSGTCTSTALFT